MANSNNSNQRGKSSGNSNNNSNSKSDTARSTRDDNVAMRAARTVRDRPYASAAIATGAVTAVAAAAAGAFFFARRDKSFKEASGELSSRVKEGLSGATDKVKDLAERGAGMFAGDSGSSSDGRTQQEIAEEAMTLKETGAANSSLDRQSNSEIKAGAVAYGA
jgi:hypothetical protein